MSEFLQFLQNTRGIYLALALVLAAAMSLFLFWRSAKRELVGPQLIFDMTVIFALGTLFGRITDFVVRSDYYNWSFAKLVFFNKYGGFDFLGAFIGGLLAIAIFLRGKKYNFWFILDLAASPLAFGSFLYTILVLVYIKFLAKNGGFLGMHTFLAGTYFLIFWALKRFEKKKQHRGFYACFYLITFAAVNLANTLLFGSRSSISFRYTLGVMLAILFLSTVSWYLLSKRKLANDLKDLFAKVMLSVFRTRRILTNIREADNLARSIILSPLYLAKLVYFLVKCVGREIYVSFLDLLAAFGVSK